MANSLIPVRTTIKHLKADKKSLSTTFSYVVGSDTTGTVSVSAGVITPTSFKAGAGTGTVTVVVEVLKPSANGHVVVKYDLGGAYHVSFV